MTNALGITGRYPPTIQQLSEIAYVINTPGVEPPNMLTLAFLVSPRIDLRRLERTFAKLVARHDALRQSIERQGDDWFVNIWNRHRTGLIAEDHGDIPDSDFRELLQRHHSVQIELFDDVLFQAIVLRCGQRGDVLLIRCHHAISDGHSMIVLIEDWLNLLIGIPLLGRGVTHEEFLSEHSKLSPRQKIDNEKYWNQLLFPALPNPGLGKFGNPGERPRQIQRTDTDRSVTCSLPGASFNEIPKAVDARLQTPFSIVLAAYSATIIELSELPGIYVSSVFDRTSNRLRNYVGCGIDFPPVRCDAADGMPLPKYASSLASQLKQSLSHLPSEAAAPELDFDMAVHKSGGLLRHFFCVLSYPDARVKKSPFSSAMKAETARKIGPLSVTRLKFHNPNHSSSGLGLRIMPLENHTNFEFVYHSHLFSEKDIQALISGMQKKLHTRFD